MDLSLVNILIFLILGAVSGLFAGMFGIGGGIIIVPSLTIIFTSFGFELGDAIRSAMASSMTNMIFVSISSFYSNYKLNYVNKEAFIKAMPAVLFGTILGLLVAKIIDEKILSVIFGIVMAATAIKMIIENMINQKSKITEIQPISRPLIYQLVFAGIGVLGGLTGLGGGFVSVPYLSNYFMPIKPATGTSSGLTLTISIVGTLFYLLSGSGDFSQTFFIGYVFWLGVLIMLPSSMLFANLGANLKKKMQDKQLIFVFSFLLILVSIKMMFPNIFDFIWQ